MEEKIPDLHVRSVDRKVWEAFKMEAARKHGKLHGVLGEELTKAMELYLEGYSQEEHTHTKRKEEKKEKHQPKDRKNPEIYANGGNLTNQGKRTYKLVDERCKKFVDAVYNGGEVHVNAFRKIIREIAGFDKRTIDKYQSILFDEYFLTVDKGGNVRPILI